MIAWSTVQLAIQNWIEAGTGLADAKVIWANQNGGQPQGTFVDMEIQSVRRLGRDWTRRTDRLISFNLTIESVDPDTDEFTVTAHGLTSGTGPVHFLGDDLPGGVDSETKFWIIRTGADTFKIANSFLRAAAEAYTAVSITSEGSGSQMLVSNHTTTLAGSEIDHKVQGLREFVLEVRCFDASPAGSNMAVALLNNVITKAQLPSVRNALIAAGIGISRFEPVLDVTSAVGQTVLEPRAHLRVFGYLADEVSETGTFIERTDVTHTNTGRTTRIPPDEMPPELDVVPSDGPDSAYVPETAAHWAQLEIPSPTHLYLCQETSGSLVDQLGGQNATAGGSNHLYQQSVAAWTRKFVGFSVDTANARWERAARIIASGESVAMLIYASFASNTATRQLASAGGSGIVNRGPALTVGGVTNRPGVFTNGIQAFGTLAHDGLAAVHPYLIVRNAVTNETKCFTDLEQFSVTHWEGVSDLVGAHIGAFGGTTRISRYGYWALWEPAQAQALIAAGLANKTLLSTLGWTIAY
jgi:hypothetical protein